MGREAGYEAARAGQHKTAHMYVHSSGQDQIDERLIHAREGGKKASNASLLVSARPIIMPQPKTSG